MEKTKKIVLKKDKKESSEGKTEKYFEAVGRRKTSIARVRFFPNKHKGKEEIVINGKPLDHYFSTSKERVTVWEPFKTLSLKDYYVSVKA